MAREAIAKTNFNSGQIAPRALGRTDVDKYFNATALMKNMIPLPIGGAQRTPGTVFVNEVRDSSKEVLLLDWVFGSRQAFILQFNDGKIRFYKDRAIVYGTSSIAVTGITNANPGVVTATSHGLSDGDHVTLSGVDGMTEVNGVEYIVANKTADTFELTDTDGNNVDTTTFGVFTLNTNIKLLLHLNTDLVDSSASPHTVTAHGGAAVSAAGAKFGAGGIALDGAGDYLTVPDHADWDFGTSDFTVHFQVKFTNVTVTDAYFVVRDATSQHFSLRYNTDSGAKLKLGMAGALVKSEDWAPVIDTYYHVAVTRNGTNLRFFIDGTQIGTATTDSSNISYADILYLGASDTGTGSVAGYMDEIVIVKGQALWTSNFTPPTAETSGGASASVQGIYEISHDFAEDELFYFQTAQSADIMYIAHPDHPPKKLSRLADADWTLADVVFQDGPFLDENTTATTLDPSGNSGSVTVTASAITGINNDEGFKTTDIGRLIRFHDGTNWCWLTITAWTSTTVVTATVTGANHVVGANLGGNVATVRWRLGAWSETTGYPRAVALFGGASWWGGTTLQQQNVWRSVVLDLENMDEGSADDADALTVPCNSDEVNVINWLSATNKRLVAGTEGQNFTIWSGSTTSTTVTPANVRSDPETNYGASGVKPIKIGSYVYYVQDDGVTLREFYYDFTIDGYRAVSKSVLWDEITAAGIKQMAFQKTPFGVLYCLLEDGTIATLTREIEQEVNGWAVQEPRTGDSYLSVAAIPVSGYHEVWFATERSINGATKKYVSYQIDPRQDSQSDLEDMILAQETLTFEGSATLISGLDHLAGEDVQVLVDGVEVTGLTVTSGGMLTLPDASEAKVIIGIQNTSQVKLLPIEGGSQSGSSQGMMKKVSLIMLRVYRSLGLKAGEDGGNMEEVFRDGNGSLLTTLQTGDFEVPSTLGWDSRQQLFFENSTPYPTTLLMCVLYEFTSEAKVA